MRSTDVCVSDGIHLPANQVLSTEEHLEDETLVLLGCFFLAFYLGS